MKLLIAASALGLLLTGCQGSSESAVAATVSAVASSSPSAEPDSPAPSPEPASPSATSSTSETAPPDVGNVPLPPGSQARVTVDLRLRTEPGLNAAITSKLAAGTIVDLIGPPWQRDADGYVWRRVAVGSDSAERQGGWVGDLPGGGFLTLEPANCPTGTVDLQEVINLTEWERLYCLHGEELVLEGSVVTGFGGMILGSFEPSWLAHPFGFSGAIAAADGYMMYHLTPGIDRVSAPDGTRLRLTGHFDDAAAESCRVATDEPPVPEPDALAISYCRERFVVTSVEVLEP